MTAIKLIEKKISIIKERIFNLGDMHPGSLSRQFNVCGSPTCSCKDPENPKKHGPYYQLSFTHKGKSTSRFIKKECIAEIKNQINNYKIFKTLVDEWKGLATELAKMRIDEAMGKKKTRRTPDS